MAKLKFFLEFSPDVVHHLDAIDRKHHGALRQTIEEQLCHTPSEETRNRKPLKRPGPFAASWELRCGPQNAFRVFCRIDVEQHMVGIVAIGVKEGNKIFFGLKEFKP